MVTALTEAVAIATKNFETTMDELKQIMSQGAADDKKKSTVKNLFCSASGEVLGASRVECERLRPRARVVAQVNR